ncbi:glutamate-5-semialdehyde dehydrogenase [Ponticaulis sp.]|uniref:glutamate-5-semialdehyde dehydrogenase n=1 Tax=Ponticaulis sp. TaxID=2020902 RepID=UPI000B6D0F11|nr:glutamate-5-semialdehyde dehydrogenase [Ponticaulis sp.]MAI90059.1 glutamate-5-semialdehyde dehydrogenase [Ponticaulis sp.]OUX99715.1 MAG: glutamate-5-semialdehyde dehydrogenase [Hyphomonadaceae bacterium TMED5]|tara:strand:- start:13812 stop:15077 length:1266 start_codon:yes stop_codon:yes gene_type:complete
MSTLDTKIEAYVNDLGARAKAAAQGLLTATTDQKNEALRQAAANLRAATPELIEANEKDVAFAREAGKPESFIDRLALDEGRIEGMAKALEDIAELPDPVGRKLAEFNRPNGLRIERVAVPIGVIGMIYESRPNVGSDASALCLKSGNAIILRGGSDSQNSTKIIVGCLAKGLAAAGLPEDAVQTVGISDRQAVTALLRCVKYVDLVIPRGGRGLVELVRDQAAVPTLLHLDGNCHVYVHSSADLDKAAAVIRNAKLRRLGVCGATESLVIDKSVAGDLLPRLLDDMSECEFRGDATAVAIDGRIKPATDDDFYTEYLDAIASVKIVDGIDEGIAHVKEHSSGHTDSIITEDQAAADRFQKEVDSAIVMHNASTQFADGGEFGMGAEIGIATGKMHARGPVGLEQLTSFKYLVHGTGQTRP